MVIRVEWMTATIIITIVIITIMFPSLLSLVKKDHELVTDSKKDFIQGEA